LEVLKLKCFSSSAPALTRRGLSAAAVHNFDTALAERGVITCGGHSHQTCWLHDASYDADDYDYCEWLDEPHKGRLSSWLWGIMFGLIAIGISGLVLLVLTA
jgi:hypothetical protein